jgi:hypothetical protein
MNAAAERTEYIATNVILFGCVVAIKWGWNHEPPRAAWIALTAAGFTVGSYLYWKFIK